MLPALKPPPEKERAERRRKRVQVCTKHSRGDIDCLRLCLGRLGWVEKPKGAERADIFWFSRGLDDVRGGMLLLTLLRSPHQRGSRLEGMRAMTHKDALERCLERLRALYPDALGFAPRTYRLPEAYDRFSAALEASRRKAPAGSPDTFILKPNGGSEGHGIFLAQAEDDVPPSVARAFGLGFVAQEYIARPLLLDGFKFDLRLYVLVCSVDPPRAYVCREGLVRLCSEPYAAPARGNLRNVFAHLTNSSLNKHHDEYVLDDAGEGDGSKRRLSEALDAGLVDDERAFWAQIRAMTALTLLAMQPTLALLYRQRFPRRRAGGAPRAGAEADAADAADAADDERDEDEEGDDSFRCFHILGFDVLLDEDGKPHLLEVNANPAMSITREVDLGGGDEWPYGGGGAAPVVTELSRVDERVKTTVVADALRLVLHRGRLPADDDAAALRSYLPVLTRATEPEYAHFQLPRRVGRVYERFAGALHARSLAATGGVSSAAFRRVAATVGASGRAAERIFTALCSRHGVTHSRRLDLELFSRALVALARDAAPALGVDLATADARAPLEAAVSKLLDADAFEEPPPAARGPSQGRRQKSSAPAPTPPLAGGDSRGHDR